MKKLITLDVGTTAVKAGIFQEDLTPLAFTIREYQLLTPQTDIVELDPQVYWDNAVAGIRDVMRQSGSRPEEVAAVTCTTQGETMIPIDDAGNVLHNAIVWLDARAKAEAEEIAGVYPPEAFYAKTGLPEVNAYCPNAKMLWIKNNKPDIYGNTYKFLLLEDYLVYKLTGQCVTNPALICSTGYFDIVRNTVWVELLERFGMDASKIPAVLPCGTAVGHITQAAAEETGLARQTIVSTGAMDQVASAIGSGNTGEGVVTETTGTCQVVVAAIDEPALEQWSPVTVYSHALDGKYLLLTMTQTAGIAMKWFRNEFCADLMERSQGNAFDEMSSLAQEAPPLSRGLFFFPCLTGMQLPENNENARGVFFGMGIDTGRDCFIRAIMEGISYTMREKLELMAVSPREVFVLGGGAKSDVWNQIKADTSGAVIKALEVEETASVGAAMLGGVACGIFADLSGAGAKLTQKKAYYPRQDVKAQYDKGYAKYLKLYGQFKPLFD